MLLVEVSPITSKVAKDSLTYFSSKDIVIGDIVSVDIRKKTYDALVVAVDDVKNRKIEVKSSDFALRKVKDKRGAAPFYREFFESCRAARDYFVGNLGQIIDYFIPREFLEEYQQLPKPKKRISDGQSVFHIAPTIREAERQYELLKSNLNTVFLIHGNLRKKKLLERYTEIMTHEGPVLVVMTPAFLFIPRHDMGSIIVHDEGNPAYRTIKRPYFDLRTFIRMLSEHMDTKLTFRDVQTLETIVEHKLKTPAPHTKDHSLNSIDMSNKEAHYKKSFIISTEVFEMIRNSNHTFLFSLKKGLASSVVCHDCGHILKDGDTPLTLREHAGERVFVNPQTGKRFDSKIRCSICDSWHFDTLGIGTDTVTEEIKKVFLKKEIFQIDGDTTTTDKKIRGVIEKFYASPDAILVGTELALPYLTEPIDSAAIISMDALLSLPSFRMYEKMLRLALMIRRLAPHSIIQTREIENPAIIAATSGDFAAFYTSEMTSREKYGYPPFNTIIRLTRTSGRDDYPTVAAPLISELTPWNPTARRLKRGRGFETSILLKLSKKIWNETYQDPTLNQILSSLGPDWQIRINPDTLL